MSCWWGLESYFCNKTGSHLLTLLPWVGCVRALTSMNQNLLLWFMGEMSCLATQNNSALDFCRSSMHWIGQHLTLIPKLEQSSRFCKQRSYHLPIFEQTSLLLLSKKLLMHMGEFLSVNVFTYSVLLVETVDDWKMWGGCRVPAHRNVYSSLLPWSQLNPNYWLFVTSV